MTAPHWKVYEPIARVSSYLDGIASLADLQVTACVGARSPAPISIAAEACTLSFSVAQVDELIDRLQRAKADVVAGKEHGDGC